MYIQASIWLSCKDLQKAVVGPFPQRGLDRGGLSADRDNSVLNFFP